MWPKGYSLAGEVIEVGDGIHDLKKGDLVACGGSGIANHAEYVAVPRNLTAKIPEGLEPSLASFTTIGAIAMHAVRQADCGLGDRVVVVGLGIIGLLAAQLLKISGCRVMGIDLKENRVEVAKRMGIDNSFRPESAESAIRTVLDFSLGVGADAVLLCAATQSDEPAHQGMAMLRRRGRLVIVGDVGLSFKRSPFYEKEIEVRISCSYGPGRYDPEYEFEGRDYPIDYVRWTLNRNMQEFMEIVKEGILIMDPMITQRVPIEEAPSVYRILQEGATDSIAVLIQYDRGKPNDIQERKVRIQPKVVRKGTLRLGVIGAGGFAQRQHIPNLLKSKISASLVAVCNRSGVNAKKAAQKYRAQYCTTDYKEIIADPSIDAVIIATRHDTHASMAADAIRAGKHVLLEKPMAIHRAELEELSKAAENADVIFTVGYNRRYSPYIQEAVRMLEKLRRPVQILYRVNAGFISPDNWTQQRHIGGGRVIGECCHFLDVMQFLVKEEVVDLSADAAYFRNSGIETYDSLTASLQYRDGSLGTLLYTCVGNKSLGKEYIEIHADQTSIIIDDFQSLKVMGRFTKNLRSKQMDKGLTAEMDAFLMAVAGQESDLVTLAEAENITNLSFQIDDLIRNHQ